MYLIYSTNVKNDFFLLKKCFTVFTAEDPLGANLVMPIFLQICSHEETNSSSSTWPEGV